jgi:hypothetical protein
MHRGVAEDDVDRHRVSPEAVNSACREDRAFVARTVLHRLVREKIANGQARNDVRFAACNNQQGSTCPSCIYFGGDDIADL